jgi:hypothetical protein
MKGYAASVHGEFEFEFEHDLVVVLGWHTTDIKGEALG